ncbi:MAG: tetratricopeptide repeat protein [Candidatus Aminicenantes bacterium]
MFRANQKQIKIIVSLCGGIILLGMLAFTADDLPEDPLQRGKVLLDQFNYQEAKNCFDMVIKENPQHKKARYWRGTALVELNNLEAAWNDFIKTLEIDPDYAPGYVGKAMIHIKKEEYDHAWNNLEKASCLDKNLVEAYYYKGVVHGYRDQIDPAINQFIWRTSLLRSTVRSHPES